LTGAINKNMLIDFWVHTTNIVQMDDAYITRVTI